MPLSLNQTVDSRYILYRFVASGGMADIYEAHDRILHKPVALKFLKEKSVDDPQAVEQFKNEARFTSIFSHMNIMKIYNVGEYENRPYISYELLKGKTIKEILDNRGNLSFDECLDYMLQILDGMNEVHSRGILHNDLKPDNMVLLPDGTIRICDFGIATHASSKEEIKIQGTANYLAPEVILNKKYSVQSDIYSCGIIFYEMLTGELPFFGANSNEVLKKHATAGEVTVKDKMFNSYNRDIDYIINKAINRSLGNRYRTDKEFITDLNKLKAHEPIMKQGLFGRKFK